MAKWSSCLLASPCLLWQRPGAGGLLIVRLLGWLSEQQSNLRVVLPAVFIAGHQGHFACMFACLSSAFQHTQAPQCGRL
jgi:hypothetical protein